MAKQQMTVSRMDADIARSILIQYMIEHGFLNGAVYTCKGYTITIKKDKKK